MIRVAWGNHAIKRLVRAFALMTIGEWILGTSFAIHAYAARGALGVALVGFRYVPAAAAGMFAARLSDSFRRERLLTATATLRAVAVGGAAVGLLLGLPFYAVLALVWIDAIAGSAYRPAQAALLPSVARSPGELTAASGLTSNAKSLGQIAGALAGGILIATGTVAFAVAVAAVLHAAAAFSTARIPDAGRPGARPAKLEERDMLMRRRAPGTARIVGYACMRSLVRGLWAALGVIVALRLLGLGKSGFGVLMAAAGAGAVLAIAAMPLLIGRRRWAPPFAAGLMLCGLPIAAIGLIGERSAAIALMVVWGVGMVLSDVGCQALLSRVVPGADLGRVTAVMESGKLLSEGSGSLLALGLLAAFGIRGALVVVGLMLPALVLGGLRALDRIDARASGRFELLEGLARVQFFRSLRVDALERVAAQLQPLDVDPGTEVVRQRTTDDRRWFLIQEGRLEVLVSGFLVNELGAGDQFGELALLRDAPRTATVRARTPARLLTLERDAFLGAVVGGGRGREVSRTSVAREQSASVGPALSHSPLLAGIAPELIDGLAGRGMITAVAEGVEVVRAGEQDDSYHVLLQGRAVVLEHGIPVRELLPGDGFGEIAVLYRVARTATVRTQEPATVFIVDGEALRAVLATRGGQIGELATR